ncbi:MAG: 16S rRNA (uracil(1498)-N(3))-methyltransferase [Candidatus Margulisbacteria bacterium]|nr:16S rRNA (uracil(1498)-N(3))-methyltransferase [Candidatus Margulisiibacteriota bacterium]
MPRVFVDKNELPEITGPAVHHLRDVLRLKAGEAIDLLDGLGNIHHAKIITLGKERISCQVLSSEKMLTEPAVKVALAQALPKAAKMDLIIEKCTELGVTSIIPLITARTEAKTAKLERWQKIAKAAAEQSGRAIIPEITSPLKFANVLQLKDQYDLALIPWELEQETKLKQALISKFPNSPIRITQSPNILILIGPEGGFTQQEIELAKNAGFTPVSLGKTILRTETAGLAALAAIMYELE